MVAEDVAEILGVTSAWVYEQSRLWERTRGARGIPTVTLGRYRRYRREAIKEWIERKEAA
jgi:predicted DNA-binding transcriptional regulator AlpA